MNKNEEKTAELLKKAIEDGRRRNYKDAVKKLKVILNTSQNFPVALLYIGRAYHQLGMYNDAVFSYRLYITREPKNDAGYFYLGRTYIALKNFYRAAACFKEAVDINPDFPPALAYCGYSEMMIGESGSAVSKLGRAFEAAPDDERIYRMYINCLMLYAINEFRNERYKTSLESFLFLEKAGFDSMTTRLYTGILYKETGSYSLAVDYIQRALVLSPDDELIKNILSELYIRLGDVDGALELLSSYKKPAEIKDFLGNIDNIEKDFAVSMWNKSDYGSALYFALSSLRNRKSYDMHLLAGECYKNTGKYEEAYNHFTRASELNKKAVEPHYGRVLALWLTNDYEEILKIIKRIKSINSEDDFAEYYKILSSWRAERPYEEWKKSLKKRLENEEDGWLYAASGWGEFSAGEYDSAVKAFRKSIKHQKELEQSWRGLFEALKITGTTAQLKTAYKNYLEIFRDDYVTRNRYSDLLLEDGNYKQAAAELKLILAKSSPDINNLKKYAFCCRKNGDYREASIIYRQILSTDPYNETYLKHLLYCMRKDGKEKETIQLLKSAVEDFSNPSIELYLVYGSTLYKNGYDEDALNVFQKCIYEGRSDWRLFHNLGILYKKKGLTEWSEMYMKKADKLKKI